MAFFYFSFFHYALITVVILCFILHYLIYSRRVERWRSSNIPFLRPVFLFGHRYFFTHLFKHSVVVPLDRIYKENADQDILAFFITAAPVILLKSPRLIKAVYAKSFDKMFENGFFPPVEDTAAMSVIPLTSDRAIWKTGRSSMAPQFSTSRLGGVEFAKVKTQVDRLLCNVEKLRESGGPIDGKEAAHNFIVDSVNLWNFGVDTNSWEKKTELYEIIGTLFALSYHRLVCFFVLSLFPFLQVFESLRFIPRKQVDSVTNFLEETMKFRDENLVDKNDFVDRLMSLRAGNVARNNNDGSKNEAQEGVSLKEMVGYSLSWLLAGSDTSSQMCLFATHLLSIHPEYQNRIREEVDEAMKKHQVSEITFEVVQDLRLTELCLLETSRLYPILPSIMRCALEDFKIPGTEYNLRRGDRVIIIPYSMHRDPKYFKDPDTFFPERFSPEFKEYACMDVYASFGCGPRKCPGYKIGMALATTFIASLLHRYELSPRSHPWQMSAYDLDPRGFTAQHRGEFTVDLFQRKPKNLHD